MKHYEYKSNEDMPERMNFDVEATASFDGDGKKPDAPAEKIRPEPAPAAKASKSAPAHYAGKKSRAPLIITLIALSAVVIGTGLFFGIRAMTNKSEEPKRETVFIEEKTELVKKGEMIEINDPELGVIEIEAIDGVARNNYDNDNFRYDENGFLAYYIGDEKASCIGIDLSEFQGDVDFKQLKKDGVDYVMLRLGGRFYGDEGELYADSEFSTYYEEAKAAGLGVGAYFFSQAASVEDGEEEAKYAMEILDGKKLDYPIAFDWEVIADDEARTDGVSGDLLTDIAEKFCDTLKDGGYQSIIYTSTSLMYYRYDLTRMRDYEFWVADYGEHPSMFYGFTMWQYTTEGTVDGIDGTVDLNICFKNY